MLERNKAVAGTRLTLSALAKRGYYLEGPSHSTAFSVQLSPDDESKRLLSTSVVFHDKDKAGESFVSFDSYVNKNRRGSIHVPFSIAKVRPSANIWLVLESDYVPNETDGEEPHDSHIWDVELSFLDVSGPATTISSYDTVYKYQRIETDTAFTQTNLEGAHISPKAMYKGEFSWIEKADFNKVALSRDGHQCFDATGNGKGVNACTSSMVTLARVG